MNSRFKVGDRVRIRHATGWWSEGRTGVVEKMTPGSRYFWCVIRLDEPYCGLTHTSCSEHKLTRDFSATDVVNKLMNED